VQDGMAVEPDHIRAGSGVPVQEVLDGFGMQPGQLLLNLGDRADAAENRAEPLTKRRRVGNR
jgi:hypothetical protein